MEEFNKNRRHLWTDMTRNHQIKIKLCVILTRYMTKNIKIYHFYQAIYVRNVNNLEKT